MSETLRSIWENTVRAAPDAVALIDGAAGRSWTRGALNAAATAWAAEQGSALAGQLVVFGEANGFEWLRVWLGLLKTDAVVAALDPHEPLAARRTLAAAVRATWLWDGTHLEPVGAPRRAARDGRRVMKLTSGSTGTPRALAFTDAQMLADGRQVCASMDIRGGDVNLGIIPFGHSYGLGNLVLPLLLQGTAIVSGVAALPQAIADACARWRPTVFPAVPALLRALALADVDAAQLGSLRTIISAGAALPPDVAEAFRTKFSRPIHNFYGSSETGGIAYDRSGDAAATGRGLGTPLEDVRLEFRRGGRFWVESAAVFTIGNRFRSEAGLGRYRPADVAELNERGELVLLGRVGRFVKIAGRRLNLAEVEQALKRIPGVRDALVTPHGQRADALAAAVAADVSSEAIRQALRAHMAPWKIPKRLLVLPTFPLTARGKIDAARLRALLAAPAIS